MAADRGTGTQERYRAMVDLAARRIRLWAHQLYEEGGRVGGFALQHWLPGNRRYEPRTAAEIAILQFVKADQVDPGHSETSYYLGGNEAV